MIIGVLFARNGLHHSHMRFIDADPQMYVKVSFSAEESMLDSRRGLVLAFPVVLRTRTNSYEVSRCAGIDHFRGPKKRATTTNT